MIPVGDPGSPDRRLLQEAANGRVRVAEADVGQCVGRELVRQRGLERLERGKEAARLGVSLGIEDTSRRQQVAAVVRADRECGALGVA